MLARSGAAAARAITQLVSSVGEAGSQGAPNAANPTASASSTLAGSSSGGGSARGAEAGAAAGFSDGTLTGLAPQSFTRQHELAVLALECRRAEALAPLARRAAVAACPAAHSSHGSPPRASLLRPVAGAWPWVRRCCTALHGSLRARLATAVNRLSPGEIVSACQGIAALGVTPTWGQLGGNTPPGVTSGEAFSASDAADALSACVLAEAGRAAAQVVAGMQALLRKDEGGVTSASAGGSAQPQPQPQHDWVW